MVGEIGQVGLFWGSHLGSLRSQAMISWDYDADIAVFLQYSGSAKSRFSQVWESASASLRKIGYACHSHTNGGKGLKLRIAPLDPKNWNEFQELRQSMAEEGGRGSFELNKAAANAWNNGQLASRPKGCNCIDVDVIYVINSSVSNKLQNGYMNIPISNGQKRINCQDVFPLQRAVFGPLEFAMPSTPKILHLENGKNCVMKPKVKVPVGTGASKWTAVPRLVRMASWPTVSLKRAGKRLIFG